MRLVFVPFLWVLLVIGLLLWPLPLPFGLLFVFIALTGLLAWSPAAVRLIRYMRKRLGWFDRAMNWLTRKAPAPYKRLLKRTEGDPA